jgi:16S rRNA (guanine966-N2)-methyltransferase
MKDRVREALFNLIGPQIKGMYAIDLFAGTGALGLEALSRGAAGATFIEQHYPTAELIRQNIETLAVGDRAVVVPSDGLLWLRRRPALPATAWLVLCSPPFDFFVSRQAEMLALVAELLAAAPTGSELALEAPASFDCGALPDAAAWDVRVYPPAELAIYRVLAVRPTPATRP